MGRQPKDVLELRFGATKALGDSLKMGLKIAGVSHKECAAELGMSVTHLNHILSGNPVRVSDATMMKVMSYLGYRVVKK